MKLAIIITLVLSTMFFVSVQGEVQSLKTDKPSYVQTDKIVFFGTAYVNDTGREINLQITGPHGNYIGTFTTTSGVNGSFQIILDTNIPKIQAEFAQSGTYSAIAFIQIRSSTPVIFDYSPIPPPPPRPLSLQPNHLSIQNTTNSTTDFQNKSKVDTNKKSIVNSQMNHSSNNILSNTQNNTSVNPNNLQQESNQQKQSVVNPPTSGPVDCNTLPSDQVYKCQQSQMYYDVTQKHIQEEQQRINQEQYQQEQQQIQEAEQSQAYSTVGIVIFIIIIIGIIVAIKRRKGSSIERMRKRANKDNSQEVNSDEDEWRGI